MQPQDAGTLRKVTSTSRSSSVAMTTVFFLIRNHLGLRLIVQIAKKTVAEATLLLRGELS